MRVVSGLEMTVARISLQNQDQAEQIYVVFFTPVEISDAYSGLINPAKLNHKPFVELGYCQNAIFCNEAEVTLTVWNCTAGPPQAVKPTCQLAKKTSLYRVHIFIVLMWPYHGRQVVG